jgi:uncharacterized protein (DUF58 family)
MISSEVRKKIRQIQIKTKRVLNGLMVGDYTTAQKGSGFEFDQIRPYEQGDDVRFIDWKSSARSSKLLFKQYLEERNRNLIICLDVSSSSLFSSTDTLKIDLIGQIAAAIGVIGEYGKDRISLILFSDKVEKFIAPGVGSCHLQKIINSIFNYQIKDGDKTDLNVVLEHIFKLRLDNSVVFLISDFITEKTFERNLKIVSQKADVIAIRCLDLIEKKIPNLGILNLVDLETGAHLTLKSDVRVEKLQAQFIERQNKILKRGKIDLLDLDLNMDFISILVKFFKKRLMY